MKKEINTKALIILGLIFLFLNVANFPLELQDKNSNLFIEKISSTDDILKDDFYQSKTSFTLNKSDYELVRDINLYDLTSDSIKEIIVISTVWNSTGDTSSKGVLQVFDFSSWEITLLDSIIYSNGTDHADFYELSLYNIDGDSTTEIIVTGAMRTLGWAFMKVYNFTAGELQFEWEKWWYSTYAGSHSVVYNDMIFADFDNDATKELCTVTTITEDYDNSQNIFRFWTLSGGIVSLENEFNFHTGNLELHWESDDNLQAYDIDSDGKTEIILFGGFNDFLNADSAKLWALNYTGSALTEEAYTYWDYGNTGPRSMGLTIGDFDVDNEVEILVKFTWRESPTPDLHYACYNMVNFSGNQFNTEFGQTYYVSGGGSQFSGDWIPKHLDWDSEQEFISTDYYDGNHRLYLRVWDYDDGALVNSESQIIAQDCTAQPPFLRFLEKKNQILVAYPKEDSTGYKLYLNILNGFEPPELLYYRTWGGANRDEAGNIAIDQYENVYLGGNTMSFGEGGTDICLIKYDRFGQQLWNRTWGGSKTDECLSVELDSENNIYIAGKTRSFGKGMDDICIVKYDSSGTKLWNRTWGGSQTEIFENMAIDHSDNVILSGSSYSFGPGYKDLCLIQFDSAGDINWNVTFGGNNNDEYSQLLIDSSNNIYLSVNTYSWGSGGSDICLVKYNSTGTLITNKTWGGSLYEWVAAMKFDSYENIYLSGMTSSFGAGISTEDLFLVKYDSSLSLLWNETWGGVGSESGDYMVIDSSDNIYTAGTTDSFGKGNYNVFLLKYSTSGMLDWNRTWSTEGLQICGSVSLDSLDNIFITGTVDPFNTLEEDLFLAKFNSSGAQVGNFTWGGYKDESSWDITKVDSLNNIYIAGDTDSFQTRNGDMVYLKIDYSNPDIIINSPIENGFFGDTAPKFNLSIIEGNLNSTWYTLDDGITNITFSEITGTINQTKWNAFTDGPITIRFYANDSLGNLGYSDVNIEKDTQNPLISIIAPNPSEMFEDVAPDYNISIVEDNFESSWYTLDYGITNVTFSGLEGTINQSIWDNTLDGNVEIRFYVRDLAGNINSNDVVIQKDANPPEISIIYPFTDAFFSDDAPTFSLLIAEPNFDSSWYTLDNGVTNITFSGTIGNISQAFWNGFSDGPVTIDFYAEDTLNRIGHSSVTVQKDTTAPTSSISFTSYKELYVVNTSTIFTLSANDGSGIGVHVIKYRINDLTWIDYSIPFNLAGFEPGEYLISYYAIDVLGNSEVIQTLTIELVEVKSKGGPDIPGYNLYISLGMVFLLIGLIVKHEIRVKDEN